LRLESRTDYVLNTARRASHDSAGFSRNYKGIAVR
jgi:hypothetical protein